MKNFFRINKIGIICFVLFVILSGTIVFAQTDLSNPEGGLMPACPATGCSFTEFMLLIDKVIRFLLFTISIPLAALCFTYAGFLYLFTGFVDQKKKALSIFKNVGIGLVIALAAWIIIKFVMSGLGYNTQGGNFPEFYNKK